MTDDASTRSPSGSPASGSPGGGDESAADRAIREALQSVERVEREAAQRKAARRASSEGEAVDLSSGEAANDAADADADARKGSASDAMLAAMIKAKQEMQDVLAQTQKEAKDMFDRLARVSADFENFKKRQSREKADAIKFANESLLKELLPVLDNLQRALGAAAGETGSLLDGVRLVARQFEDAFGKFGVQGFDALGAPFDPVKHEAIGSRPDANVAAQLVCEEYQRGYMIHDRLLRPALVIVSQGVSPVGDN